MITEEKIAWTIASIFFAIIFAIILQFSFAKKPVVRYNLGSDGMGSLRIRVDIENCYDGEIPLIGVDYERAIAIVDSLNAELNRHPRK